VLAAVVIFALTYLAIAAGRVPGLSIDRPAAALLGAALMVAAGVLGPAEAGRSVNGETPSASLGMMIPLGLPGRGASSGGPPGGSSGPPGRRAPCSGG
jgi:Na+/H+ antiporter NhaD/arsenite permease-like protein